jgi:hypothetical protein
MPRRGNTEGIKEDYLDIDRELPGQRFVCLSFVSPDKILKSKNTFFYYRYLEHKLATYKKAMDDAIQSAVKCASNNNTVKISEIVQMKKQLNKLFKEDAVDFDGFSDKIEDFRVGHEVKIYDEFDQQNDFQTSTRGVKVRGTFNTREEADARAHSLQREDPTFDVFVGQVGYWLPWDPTPEDVGDMEYAEDHLNKLVKGQKDNMAKKDMFFMEQKDKRVAEANEENERMKAKLLAKKRAEEEGVASKEDVRNEENVANKQEVVNAKREMNDDDIESLLDKSMQEKMDNIELEVGDGSPVIETAKQLSAEDPWMQRKLESANATDQS